MIHGSNWIPLWIWGCRNRMAFKVVNMKYCDISNVHFPIMKLLYGGVPGGVDFLRKSDEWWAALMPSDESPDIFWPTGAQGERVSAAGCSPCGTPALDSHLVAGLEPHCNWLPPPSPFIDIGPSAQGKEGAFIKTSCTKVGFALWRDT